jgi:hypothetical protein
MQIVEHPLPDRSDRADATRTGSMLITPGDRRLRDRLE